MARKIDIEAIIADWVEIRKGGHPFLSKLSREAFIGYCTAMSMRENLSSGLSAEEWYKLLNEAITA